MTDDLLPCIICHGGTSNRSGTGHPVCIGCEHLQGFEPVEGLSTLANLLDREIPPTRYAIDGLFPEGLIVLGGKPKVGKSWLVGLMALSVASGGKFLDAFACEPGEVLHIAYEDGNARLQSRYKIVGGRDLDRGSLERIHLRTDWPTLEADGIADLDDWLTDHPDARLVVIDTFQRFRGSSNLSAKDRYAHDYEQAAKLQTLAVRHRIALVVVHHLRQQGAEDWLDQISGTSGITGAADTLVALFRERGEHDATLRYLGRDVDEGEVALRFNGGVWENLGDPEIYRTTRERREILDTLDKLGPSKVSDVALHLGKKVAAVSYLLRQLEHEGKVHTPKFGHYDLKPLHPPLEPLEVTPPLQGLQGNQGGERKG